LIACLTSCDATSIPDEADEGAGDERIERPVSAALAEELTERVNAARGKARVCGDDRFAEAPPLTWSDDLAAAALQHAHDMAANDHFSHTGTDGSSAGDRIAQTGYEARTWGENIAAGYQSAEQVVAGWLDSPGHCANIMNDAFAEFGTAFDENDASSFRIYWTMVLAAPR
jgi:uncharacterized protein YkwD